MSGSSTDWIRLAELREDEAAAIWARSHPWLTLCSRLAKQLRVRVLLWLASERGRSLVHACESARQKIQSQYIWTYLGMTRVSRCRPARQSIDGLSTRALLDELERRGVDHGGCVERGDLLDALCGTDDREHNINRKERGLGSASWEQESLTSVDKMV